MNNLFKNLFYSNDDLIIALFHLQNSIYTISNISNNSRTIIKKRPIYHLTYYMPFIHDFLQNFFKSTDEISYLINETYYPSLNKFTYEISLNENELFNDFNVIYNIKFFIHLTLQKNKIIIHFDINKNDFNLDINTNPLHHTIILLALNYLENNHIDYLKNEIILKDVKSIINRHSFELDII